MFLTHLKLYASVDGQTGPARMEIPWIPHYERSIAIGYDLMIFQLIVAHCFYVNYYAEQMKSVEISSLSPSQLDSNCLSIDVQSI